jgi:hypothetical protein
MLPKMVAQCRTKRRSEEEGQQREDEQRRTEAERLPGRLGSKELRRD